MTVVAAPPPRVKAPVAGEATVPVGLVIVTVGGNQDHLVGECRVAVKVLRQRAGMAMATDPKTAEVAKELRKRTQEVLRNPSSYEAPRH